MLTRSTINRLIENGELTDEELGLRLLHKYKSGQLGILDFDEVLLNKADLELEVDHSPERDDLVMKYCQDIAGKKGKKSNPPDPVTLLEMCEALLKAGRIKYKDNNPQNKVYSF